MFIYVRWFLWVDGYRRKVATISPESLKARRGKAWRWGSNLLQTSPGGELLTLIAACLTMTTQIKEVA